MHVEAYAEQAIVHVLGSSSLVCNKPNGSVEPSVARFSWKTMHCVTMAAYNTWDFVRPGSCRDGLLPALS